MSPDQQQLALMQSIRAKFHAEIQEAAAGSGVPAEFLGALVANETGGNPDAKRFEKGVLASLWEVLQGRAAHFGSIGRDDLYNYISSVTGDQPPLSPSGLQGRISNALQSIDSLATSWGLTQIMGYEAIAFQIETATFQQPLASLNYTCRLLKLMATGKGLNVGKDFGELFDCWNTGRPTAPTADPRYIPNGLLRLSIYQELQEEPPAAGVPA